MNDKPNVLKLNINEWKALTLQRISRLGDGISQIGEHLQKQQAITPQMLLELDQFWAMSLAAAQKQWDDVKLPLKGWEQISRPLIAEYEAQQKAQAVQPRPMQQVDAIEYAPPAEVVASFAEPRKRGGWPKGKSRKPKGNASAAVLPPVTQ